MSRRFFAHPFILSCQPLRGGALDRADFVAAYARMAEAAGAGGVRIESVRDLGAARQATALPMVGLVKRQPPGFELYITPEVADVHAVADAGADLIAFDGTARARPVPVAALIAAIHACGCAAMADVSTFAEGVACAEAGADLIATTLSGYTPYSPNLEGPDVSLVEQLAQAGIPTVAEGRIGTPGEAQAALEAGALAVTVGSAITRPETILAGFMAAVRQVPARDGA